MRRPRARPVAAGYLKIRNHSAVADKLTGGSADFAGAVEVHGIDVEGAVMTMGSRQAVSRSGKRCGDARADEDITSCSRG